MSEDPTRLVEDPSVSDLLRSDLRSVIDHPPAIPLPAEPPLPPSGPAFLGPALVVGALVLGLGGYAIVQSTTASTAPETRAMAPSDEASSAATTSAAAPEAEERPEQPETAPTLEETGPAPARAEPEAPASSESAREPAIPEGPTREATPSEPPSLSDEIAHMGELRRIADTDPRRALAMARAGERRFASGLFGEERQALIVLSLDRLGRDDAARRAARRFLRRHPESTFRARIEPVADEGSQPP